MQAFSSHRTHDATRPGGFFRAGEILKQQHGDLLISHQKLRQAERVTLVREKRASGDQILGFATRPFVLCGLPVRRPSQSDLIHETKRLYYAADHWSSRIRIAIWARPPRSYLSLH